MATTTLLGGKGSQHIDSTPAVGQNPFDMVDHIEVRTFGTSTATILAINTKGIAVGFTISKADLQGLITVLQGV